jgi:hypothetical protein
MSADLKMTLSNGKSGIRSFSTVENCVFRDNSGGSGGAIKSSHSGLTIRSCLFMNNSASSAGALTISGNGPYIHTITDCTFINNSAYRIGAVNAVGTHSAITFTNCFFKDNRQTMEGEPVAVKVGGTSATFLNCVFDESPLRATVIDNRFEGTGPIWEALSYGTVHW